MIEICGLRHRWGRRAPDIVFDDFVAQPGEQWLLRGASGSGKSTLLALLAGLLTPTAGQLRVGGVDLVGLGARARDVWRGQTMGFVPQGLHLVSGLSVQRNLELPYLAAGLPVDTRRIAAVLDRLGLGSLATRRPSQLSGGQAQRVALARAVLRRPSWLLADEPTAHLDDAHALAAVQLLATAAHEDGAGLLIATHDQRLQHWLPEARCFALGGAGSAPVVTLTLPTAAAHRGAMNE